MKSILVVAPHPDDETLGCGGTLLRMAKQGTRLGWLIVTGLNENYSEAQHQERSAIISEVSAGYGFDRVYSLNLPTTKLDTLPLAHIIESMAGAINDFQPEWLLLPHHGDVHSDHRIVFAAGSAFSKWFRYPFIKRVSSYETLSETEFSLDHKHPFQPTTFFDISDQLQGKLEMLSRYSGECGHFPFPRSADAVTAQARLRGSQAGYAAAEAFTLLRERHD